MCSSIKVKERKYFNFGTAVERILLGECKINIFTFLFVPQLTRTYFLQLLRLHSMALMP
jgi:hypothetical protein